MIAIVSNMLILRRACLVRRPLRGSNLCNMGATLCRRIAWAALASICISAPPAYADPPAPNEEHRSADVAQFLAGAAVGFVAHEAGHLFFDVVFDAQPYVKAVHFGPLPFFAI